MKILRGVLDVFSGLLPSVLIGMLVLVVLVDVAGRNILHMSIPWAHDLTIILMSAAVWFALADVARNDQMFGVAVLTGRLPQAWQGIAAMLKDLLVILIAAETIRAAVAQITSSRFTTFLSLGWPKWIVALFLALGMAAVVLERVLTIIDRLVARRVHP